MTPALKRGMNGTQVQRVLRKRGFTKVRNGGSHIILEKNGIVAVVSKCNNQPVAVGMIEKLNKLVVKAES